MNRFRVRCPNCNYEDNVNEFYSYTNVEVESSDGVTYTQVFFECPECHHEERVDD